MAGLLIAELTNEMVESAAAMLARAFVTNPIHVAAFGANQLAKNEAFFRMGLALMKGPKHVAVEDGHVLGLIHWVEAPACQPSAHERHAVAPTIVRAFGIRTSWHLNSWLSAWSRHDPGEPHVHLGPIGVSPEAQGHGIGHRLMQLYCQQLDREKQVGYLETDRPGIVPFYEEFDFQVTEEIEVLGLPNFLMTRPSRP